MNPFGTFRDECTKALKDAMLSIYPSYVPKEISLEFPPYPELGELAFSYPLKLSKFTREDPYEIAKKIVENIDVSKFNLIKSVEIAKPGYVNFKMNYTKMASIVLDSVIKDPSYGFIRTSTPQKIIVEHTSTNPIHPIHIGAGRNPILGDSIARMLKARGHEVRTHFFINDLGKQVAIAVYGYEKVKDLIGKEKPDHFIGKVYAITCCIVEILSLKNKKEKYLQEGKNEEAKRIQAELDEWIGAIAELERKHPKLFNRLIEEIKKDLNPEKSIKTIMKLYEQGEEPIAHIVKEMCEFCIKGLKDTLQKIGVDFDSWDWESELSWRGKVKNVLVKLARSPYVFVREGCYEFNAQHAAEELNLHEKLGIEKEYALSSLTLTRRNGLTLYTLRDMAYTLQKFSWANKVINVIGAEQSLAQFQLKIALCVLNKEEFARNLIHFAYGLVTIPGYKMSSRKGRYITFDEALNEAARRAYEESKKRSPQLSEEELKKIANAIGVGALKYALISLEPHKDMVFSWDRILSFERNSGPFIQYSYARACSILRKAKQIPKKADYSILRHKLEKSLILQIAKFPDIFIEATESLRPNLIAEFSNSFAEAFNLFYDSLPVLKAETSDLRKARLLLVKASQRVLKNALYLLGIEPIERM